MDLQDKFAMDLQGKFAMKFNLHYLFSSFDLILNFYFCSIDLITIIAWY